VTTAIWWIRRDLRLHDNQALSAALQAAAQVIPLFILDDVLLRSSRLAEIRLRFLLEGLRQLDADLREIGSRLVVKSGDPHAVLSALVSSGTADAIFAEEDYSPYARRRDARIRADLPLTLAGSAAILPPGAVLKSDGTPYTVFTPFSRSWLGLFASGGRAPIPPPTSINTPESILGQPIPTSASSRPLAQFPSGEQAALPRMQAFTGGEAAGIYRYALDRNRLDLDGTSILSPYLRFGMLSPLQLARSAWRAIMSAPGSDARQGAETFLNELIWRDFYLHILYHFPHVMRNNFRLDGIRWEYDSQAFQAWCDGCTGYPVVDACMRQLLSTGWMHNRGRMIVASFLTKDLLIDWRWGEKFFMQHLLDGDPAANNGGWQWTAGTGTDAAPYFRIFNPVLQGMKFDPQGAFIRRWVPELSQVSDPYIHEPWKMPLAEGQKAGCRVGKDYPNPIIEHAWARQRALAAYAQAKTS
jgi:deoxyribodipyrimidine photo-lyase